MGLLTKITSAKANMVGTTLIAACSSMLTVFVMNGFNGSNDVPPATAMHALPATQSALECGAKVYSPVQRQCVSQEIFDGEMKRLFAALGIDTSIYDQSENN